MTYDPKMILEPADPVAHPHYPRRPGNAAVVTHSLLAEPEAEHDVLPAQKKQPQRSSEEVTL